MNTTTTREMTMKTKAIRSERALAVAKWLRHSLTTPGGFLQYVHP
jgi:hypothetical protein